MDKASLGILSTPLTREAANDLISAYQENPIADFNGTTSYIIEKEKLEEYFPDSTHYHIFLGREGDEMRIVVAGVKDDASHEYKMLPAGKCVLQHIEPCSSARQCRIETSVNAINEILE